MILKEKVIESYTWIDIEGANKKELEIIASKYNTINEHLSFIK